MKTISMLDFQPLTQNLKPQELILDVRGPDEFGEGHVPGAKNIPHTEVSRHLAELKKYNTVYLYCRSGGRSTAASLELARAGLTHLVCINSGGMPDWIAAGFPVER